MPLAWIRLAGIQTSTGNTQNCLPFKDYSVVYRLDHAWKETSRETSSYSMVQDQALGDMYLISQCICQ